MFETAHDGFNLRFFSDTKVVLLAADSVHGRVLRLRLAHGFYYLARKGFDASLSEPGKLNERLDAIGRPCWNAADLMLGLERSKHHSEHAGLDIGSCATLHPSNGLA